MAQNKKTPFPPWQTDKPGGIEARYIRLGNSQLVSEAMLKLTHSAHRVYIYMLLESGGKPMFEFPHCKFSKIVSNGGFQKALAELVEAGFIIVEQNNGNVRKANIYRFSEAWKSTQ